MHLEVVTIFTPPNTAKNKGHNIEISDLIDRNGGKTDFVARNCCHVDFGVNVYKFALFRNDLRCEIGHMC